MSAHDALAYAAHLQKLPFVTLLEEWFYADSFFKRKIAKNEIERRKTF